MLEEAVERDEVAGQRGGERIESITVTASWSSVCTAIWVGWKTTEPAVSSASLGAW
jgi:hypothetical protein